LDLRILKSVPFSDPSPAKLTTAAKPDMLSEVVVRQRLTIDFVISSGVAKSSRLKLRNRGLQVQVLPGVLKLAVQWRSEARRDRDAGKQTAGSSPAGRIEKHWETSAFRISDEG
jgi:hypothetical protein